MAKRILLTALFSATVVVGLIELVFGPGRHYIERARRERVIAEYEEILETAQRAPLDPTISAAIIERTRDKRRWDRTQAYAQISQIAFVLRDRPNDMSVVSTELAPALHSGLSDSDPYVRREAARACAELAASGALPSDLLPDLRDGAELLVQPL